MTLSYKCLAKEIILKDLRTIRFANNSMLFGLNNTKELVLELDLDLIHISNQADVFAREMLTHRSRFDLKRILGPFEVDWSRILHEAYVYDRLKCIYYGISSYNMLRVPENTYSFPGNALLLNLLIKKSFQFSTNDEQNYTLYVSIKHKSIKEILDPIFEYYPDLKEGLSDDERVISWVNYSLEGVLKGLYNAKEFLNAKEGSKGKPQLFEVVALNDSKIEQFTVDDSNPVMNSFLSKDGEKFFFILPYNESSSDQLRFNESLYISRALGFTSQQLTEGENNFYKVAQRNALSDPFAREEVYAITGLRTNITPLSSDRIKEYLGINSYKAESIKVKELYNNNGVNDSTP